MRAAFARGEASRVLAFFNAFLNAHPEYRKGSPAPRSSSRSSARSFASNAPVWTTKAIADFYDKARRGLIPEKEKAALEQQIIAAGNAGRVVRG